MTPAEAMVFAAAFAQKANEHHYDSHPNRAAEAIKYGHWAVDLLRVARWMAERGNEEYSKELLAYQAVFPHKLELAPKHKETAPSALKTLDEFIEGALLVEVEDSDALEAAIKDRDAWRERAEKAEAMLEDSRKALATYFGRTCQDIVPEVKYAITQLADAREQRDAITNRYGEFIRGVFKALDLESVTRVDEVALLHKIKQAHEERDSLRKRCDELGRITRERDDLKKYNDEMGDECSRLQKERDAYRKAKQENDERFMNERDAARAEAAAARAEAAAARAKRDVYQLERDDARRALDNMYAVRDALAGKAPAYITGWSYTKHAGYPVAARVTFSRFPEQFDSAVVPREDFSMLIAGDGRLEKLSSAITGRPATPNSTNGPIDDMIGRLDRLLSEFLLAADCPQDEADRQTLKHHADDLIGVGNAALKKLAPADPTIGKGYPTQTRAKVAHAVDIAIARIRENGTYDESTSRALRTLEACVRTELGLNPDQSVEARLCSVGVRACALQVRALDIVVLKEI